MRSFHLSSGAIPRNAFEAQAKSPSAAGRERELLYEQIVYAYREYLPGTIPVVFGGLLVVVVMWNSIANATLLCWLAVLYGATAIRVYWSLKFTQHRPAIDAIDPWRWGFLLGSAVAGAIWGSVGFLMFVPESLPLQMFLLGCIFAICAGAVSVIGYYLPAFYAFAILLVLPSIVRHALMDQATHWLIAAICSIFLVSFLGFGRRQNRFVVDTLKIRYENTDLIEQLKAQTLAAESATANSGTCHSRSRARQTGSGNRESRQVAVSRHGEPRSAPAVASDRVIFRSATRANLLSRSAQHCRQHQCVG